MHWPWKKKPKPVPAKDFGLELDQAYSNQMRLLRRGRSLLSQLEISERSLKRSKSQSAKDQLEIIKQQKSSLAITLDNLTQNIRTIRRQRRQLKVLSVQTQHLESMSQISEQMQASYESATTALNGIESEITLRQALIEVDQINRDFN